MKFWLAITDSDWFARLAHLKPDELNFWQPGGSVNEDRLHGRAIGGLLSWLRNMAINLLRRVWPVTFIPDACCRLSVAPRIALRWLHVPLMN